MEVKIVWEEKDAQELFKRVSESIEELDLWKFIKFDIDNNEDLRLELNITSSPALVIIEPEIDFRDVIFQWETPEKEEIMSMFMSIIWVDSSSEVWWCETWGCNTCAVSSSCWSSK